MTDNSDKKISNEDLVKQFESQHNTSLKPDQYLMDEIDRVHAEVQSLVHGYKSSEHMVMNDPVNDSRFFSDINETEQRITFKKGYDAGFKYKSCPELTKEAIDKRLMVILENGFAYGKYSRFLLGLQTSNAAKPKSKSLTPLKTQMAILELLGVTSKLAQVGHNTDVSAFLSILLNGNVENIRKLLSSPYIVKDEVNAVSKSKRDVWTNITTLAERLGLDDFVDGIEDKMK